jgi:hypothetical protein
MDFRPHLFFSAPWRMGMASAGLAGAITVGVLGTGGPAMASQGVCRSDPVVVLSNLQVMDLSATINDNSSDLNNVSYSMSLPQGVRPLLVIATDGLVGQHETFSWTANQPAGQYSVTTYVSTGATVPVTAVGISILSKSYSQNGTSNENITVTS